MVCLLKIDDSNCEDYVCFIDVDGCFYLFEYIFGKGYFFSVMNNLISNFKKKLLMCGKVGYQYK